MEMPLSKFCFKTSEFLKEEAKKLKSEKGEGFDPEYAYHKAFIAAADAIHSLGFQLEREDNPLHDSKIHLGHFGFKEK